MWSSPLRCALHRATRQRTLRRRATCSEAAARPERSDTRRLFHFGIDPTCVFSQYTAGSDAEGTDENRWTRRDGSLQTRRSPPQDGTPTAAPCRMAIMTAGHRTKYPHRGLLAAGAGCCSAFDGLWATGWQRPPPQARGWPRGRPLPKPCACESLPHLSLSA